MSRRGAGAIQPSFGAIFWSGKGRALQALGRDKEAEESFARAGRTGG